MYVNSKPQHTLLPCCFMVLLSTTIWREGESLQGIKCLREHKIKAHLMSDQFKNLCRPFLCTGSFIARSIKEIYNKECEISLSLDFYLLLLLPMTQQEQTKIAASKTGGKCLTERQNKSKDPRPTCETKYINAYLCNNELT